MVSEIPRSSHFISTCDLHWRLASSGNAHYVTYDIKQSITNQGSYYQQTTKLTVRTNWPFFTLPTVLGFV